MSNNNNSLIVIGIAAAVLLCGMAGAIIAISSDSNDTNDSNENMTYYKGEAKRAFEYDGNQIENVKADLETTASIPTQMIYAAQHPEVQ